MKKTVIRQLCDHCTSSWSQSSISGIMLVEMPKSLKPSAISGM